MPAMKTRTCILVLLGALASSPLPATAAPNFAWSANYGGMSSSEDPQSGHVTAIATAVDGNVVIAGSLTVPYPEVRLHVWKHRPTAPCSGPSMIPV